MAVFPSFNLTKKGEELLNRSIGEGRVLTFTKFKIGDGVPTGDWRDLDNLQSSFKEFSVLETAIQADQVLRIRGYFDNKGFATDKQFKEIGVFVTLDGVAGEHLYSYTNAGDTGDVVPAESRGFYSRTLDVNNYIGYATNITFNIEQTRDNYDFNTENELKVATFLKKGDKIRLWGRLVLGDIETLNYIATDEVTSLTLNNGLYCKLAGDNIVSNIETDLVNLKGAVVGDVVEVLGFHTKGDGSHHKRIAKAENDGSGELGQNGIWWCIIHNGEVNVDWLGCELVNGKYILNNIEKAIMNGVNVISFSANKRYLLNKQIVLTSRINISGNGAIIYLSDDNFDYFIDYQTAYSGIHEYLHNAAIRDLRFIGSESRNGSEWRGNVFKLGNEVSSFGSRVLFDNIKTYGVGTVFKMYNNSYLYKFNNCEFSALKVFEVIASGDSGENLTITNTVMSAKDCVVTSKLGHFNWNFVSCSFDYSNLMVDTSNHVFNFTNCHLEACGGINSTGPDALFRFTDCNIHKSASNPNTFIRENFLEGIGCLIMDNCFLSLAPNYTYLVSTDKQARAIIKNSQNYNIPVGYIQTSKFNKETSPLFNTRLDRAFTIVDSDDNFSYSILDNTSSEDSSKKIKITDIKNIGDYRFALLLPYYARNGKFFECRIKYKLPIDSSTSKDIRIPIEIHNNGVSVFYSELKPSATEEVTGELIFRNFTNNYGMTNGKLQISMKSIFLRQISGFEFVDIIIDDK